MNKVQLLEKAKKLNIDANQEMTNAEIEELIAEKAPDKSPFTSTKNYNGPLLVYPNGVEVAVKAKDAKEHQKRIFKQTEIHVEIKNMPKEKE